MRDAARQTAGEVSDCQTRIELSSCELINQLECAEIQSIPNHKHDAQLLEKREEAPNGGVRQRRRGQRSSQLAFIRLFGGIDLTLLFYFRVFLPNFLRTFARKFPKIRFADGA
jgi:hypothetical protein